MISEYDEKNGIVKTYWENVRKRVAKVEPSFAKIVDELNPNKSFPLYLAYYPYGAIEADTESSLLPNGKGGYYRLTDSNIPKDISTHLGYGKNSSPLGMVLEKELELFIDKKSEGVTIPWLMYTPGKIFPFARILSEKNGRVYAPNGLLSSAAGARSIFLLPNIGCATNHANLQRDFNIHSPPPKSLYEQWHVFKEIINSPILNSDWRCCVLYFSEKWINSIHHNKQWADLKQYLHELAWSQYEHERNRIYYDIAFSIIKKKRHLKPNPYLADTARHLFTTAMGAAPGYAPTLNDNAIPLEIVQKAYIESYGIKKYFPTIMSPIHFIFEKNPIPVYYSLQHPSTYVFSPKSREVSSTITEMRELSHIMRIFIDELSKKDSICADTIIASISKNVQFNYFHNKTDCHRIVTQSSDLLKLDSRFHFSQNRLASSSMDFASDSPFLRGCISMSVSGN